VKPAAIKAGLLTLTALLIAACDVLLPRALSGQVLTNDQRVDVPCTLSVYEALDTPHPILISTASIATGKKFEASVRSRSRSRTGASQLWVPFNCEGYFPRVRGFSAGHLSVWHERVVDLGVVTVERW
jgi:hypothetical protein